MACVLAIDQGTTSTRAAVFDETGACLASENQELTQHFPQPGWVEHDAEEIWQSVAEVIPRTLTAAKIEPKQITGIGITNQRETCLFWERGSGRPIHRALVWQDRRTAGFCLERKADEPWLRERTGLVLDPYFSATKARWLLEQSPAWRLQAEAGKLAWGTIDSYLLYRLTSGKTHATDVTNASRTLLFDLKKASWDDELCNYFSVPRAVLPATKPSVAHYGNTVGLGFLPDGIPIHGIAGDQQAALFGQRAFTAGQAKCTYGTGAFFLMHTGDKPMISQHRLLTTMAATLDEKPLYALEGSIFIAGAAVQWLRDGMKFFDQSAQIEDLAARADKAQEVIFVPALVGLGAPHWIPGARGVLFGLTRNTSAAELCRAALEGVAFQVADLIEAARGDAGRSLESLWVDGGMARNAWFLQFQADMLGLPVIEATQSEATALGAAFLAGLGSGIWSSCEAIAKLPHGGKRFIPQMNDADRARRISRWKRAVSLVISFYGAA